jgi:hypothetical protein
MMDGYRVEEMNDEPLNFHDIREHSRPTYLRSVDNDIANNEEAN